MTEQDLSLQTQSLQHFGNKVLRKTKMLAVTLDTCTASVNLVYIAVRRYSLLTTLKRHRSLLLMHGSQASSKVFFKHARHTSSIWLSPLAALCSWTSRKFAAADLDCYISAVSFFSRLCCWSCCLKTNLVNLPGQMNEHTDDRLLSQWAERLNQPIFKLQEACRSWSRVAIGKIPLL